jgi:hypothetical protein
VPVISDGSVTGKEHQTRQREIFLEQLEDIGFEATCNAFVKKLKESM